MPVVTITDYVTVYPSAPAATAFSSIQPPPTIVQTNTHSDVHSDMRSAVLSIISSSKAQSMPTPTLTPNFSTAPAFSWTPTLVSSRICTSILPSISATPSFPAAHSEPLGRKHWKPDIASLSLAAIIISALLILALLVWAMYSRLRTHKCSLECEEMRAELQKYKNGDLKPITPAMVEARERRKDFASFSTTSTRLPRGPELDLEKGEVRDRKRVWQADVAIAAPNAPEPIKLSFWNRAFGKFKSKSEQSRSVPPAAVSDTNIDRVFDISFLTDLSHNSSHPSQEKMLADSLPRTLSNARKYYRPRSEQSEPCRPGLAIAPDTHYDRPSANRSSHPPHLPSPDISDYGISPINVNGYVLTSSRGYDVSPTGSQPDYKNYTTGTTWPPRHMDSQYLSADPDQRASVVSSSLRLYDSRWKAQYDEAQRIIASGKATDEETKRAAHIVNAVEGQMRKKKRPEGYGGLGTLPRSPMTIQRIPPVATGVVEARLATYSGKGKERATDEEVDMQQHQDHEPWWAKMGRPEGGAF